MRPCIVWWLDAHHSGDDGLLDKIQDHEGLLTKSCGFLASSTPVGVTIVYDLYEDDPDMVNKYKGYTFIPKAMIVRIEEF